MGWEMRGTDFSGWGWKYSEREGSIMLEQIKMRYYLLSIHCIPGLYCL